MADSTHYSLEDDLDAAHSQAAADDAVRDLPEQIDKVRQRIRAARERLSGADELTDPQASQG